MHGVRLHRPRNATVVAETDCLCLEMSHDHFMLFQSAVKTDLNTLHNRRDRAAQKTIQDSKQVLTSPGCALIAARAAQTRRSERVLLA